MTLMPKVSEAIQIGAQAMKENNVTVEEVYAHLQELEENVASHKQVDEALGMLSPIPFHQLLST